jgi:hypothetical protein
METNKPHPAPAPREGREPAIPHLPDSECEKILYNLATDCKPTRVLAAMDALCPTCARRLAKLFAIEKLV